jgi:hypothetical protein
MRVAIYANDHRPAHVHVIGSDGEAVFQLNCPLGPAELRENFRFSRRKMRQISRSLAEHLEELCGAWEEIHGVA